MSLAEHKRADRRLIMLRALASESDYSITDTVLRMLLAEFGHDESMNTIHADLQWLESRDLVTLRDAGELMVATVTARGVDVAYGRERIEGVRRPRPGE